MFFEDVFPCIFDSPDRVQGMLNFGGYDLVIGQSHIDGT